MMKKGALPWDLIVIATGIIFALAVLIYFAVHAFTYPDIDKEACHQSVLQRGTIRSDSTGLDATKLIPLNCKTEKICISYDGQDCMEFSKPSKDNPVTKIEVSGNDPKTASMEKISESLYDCHEMLGRGMLNFAPSNWGFTNQNYCVICSRIAFDEKAKLQVQDISYAELYRYMQQEKNKEGQSYLSFIYNWKDWSSSKTLFENVKSSNVNNPNVPSSFEEWKISSNKNGGYVVVAQLTEKSRMGQIAGVVSAATGLVVGGPVGWGIIIGGGALTWYSTPDDANIVYAPPTIMPYDVQTLRSLGCSSFETAPSSA